MPVPKVTVTLGTGMFIRGLSNGGFEMKKAILVALLVGVATLFSVQAFAGTASEDLQGVIDDPAYFDGGPGSTLNE